MRSVNFSSCLTRFVLMLFNYLWMSSMVELWIFNKTHYSTQWKKVSEKKKTLKGLHSLPFITRRLRFSNISHCRGIFWQTWMNWRQLISLTLTSGFDWCICYCNLLPQFYYWLKIKLFWIHKEMCVFFCLPRLRLKCKIFRL